MGDSKYELQKVLGSGCFGFVFLANRVAQDGGKGELVAIKRIEKVGKVLSREFEILRTLQNTKHCVLLKECFFTQSEKGKLVQNLVLEYLRDDLEKLISRYRDERKRMEEKLVKLLAYQLFKGLEEIHERNIVHRDLKPENVLMGKNGVLKLCDFGSSKFIDHKGKNTPYIVSRFYRAPELFLCMTTYSGNIDVWAAGCILCELFTLQPMFKAATEGEQFFEIQKILGSFTQSQTDFFIEEVRFNPNILHKFPKYDRDEVLLEKRFGHLHCKKELMDLLNKVFDYNPKKRYTAKEVLSHPFFSGVEREYQEHMKNAERTSN